MITLEQITQAGSDWETERVAAATELEALETQLQTDYDAYCLSLANYLERLAAANEVRQTARRLVDMYNSTAETRTSLDSLNHDPLENKGIQYALISRHYSAEAVVAFIESCDVDKINTLKSVLN